MPGARSGFTLVEVLVAIVLLGIGAAALASALAGQRRLSAMADVESGIALAARERLETIGARPCDVSLSGSRVERWGEERWAATADRVSWTLVDTLSPRGVRTPVLITSRVPCRA